MSRKPGGLWRALGGRVPKRERWSVWFVTNEALGIRDPHTRRHPALVTSSSPLVVVSGSDSFRHDLDAKLVHLSNDDLRWWPRGCRFETPTTFDVGRPLGLDSDIGFLALIGQLTNEAVERVLAKIEAEW